MALLALGQPADEALGAGGMPSSSAAGVSLELVKLPDLPRFHGPANDVLATARWAAPLLMLGALYTLAIHGQLSLLALTAVGVMGSSAVLAAHTTLVFRRRRLLRTARALRAYAERTVGDAHELYRRSAFAVSQLESDPAGTCDPGLTTDVEQGIGYTRELLLTGVKDGRETPPRRAPRGARPL